MNNKKNIFLVDITHRSELGFGSDTMPLQIGLLGSYCKKYLSDLINIELFKFIDDLDNKLLNTEPFILAFSNYIWNVDLSYQIATIVKNKYPKTIIVFGGPNYPEESDEQEKWLKKYKNIDFYVYKDGEYPFYMLVKHLLEDSIEKVKTYDLPSLHFISNNKLHKGELAKRIRDLNEIPSPYEMGLMDKFFNKKLIPTIQTNRGCPFTCTFCVEGLKYYTKVHKTNVERSIDDVEYIIERIEDTKTLRITDSNFGMFVEDVELCTVLNKKQKDHGYPEYINCSAGKNKKERILKCNELVGGALRLTASVQSLEPDVLKNIKRTNISVDAITALADQVSGTDTHSYSEIILALPGDTLKSEINTMKNLTDSGISNITQHQLSLIPGTEMSSKESRIKYNLKNKFRPIQRCLGKYNFLNKDITSIEIEEICISTNTMSYEEYLESRRIYLSVGIFYNDKIFGEINNILRLLNLSVWDWLYDIHVNIENSDKSIKLIYDNFVKETENELWNTEEELRADIGKNLNKYLNEGLGGNLIYKYRSQAIMNNFDNLHEHAFKYLKKYLIKHNCYSETLLENLERFSKLRKFDLSDLEFSEEHFFDYDMYQLINLNSFDFNLNLFKKPTKIKISHSEEQKEMINRQMKFYEIKNNDYTFLMSRFPIKRYYRKSEYLT